MAISSKETVNINEQLKSSRNKISNDWRNIPVTAYHANLLSHDTINYLPPFPEITYRVQCDFILPPPSPLSRKIRIFFDTTRHLYLLQTFFFFDNEPVKNIGKHTSGDCEIKFQVVSNQVTCTYMETMWLCTYLNIF